METKAAFEKYIQYLKIISKDWAKEIYKSNYTFKDYMKIYNLEEINPKK